MIQNLAEPIPETEQTMETHEDMRQHWHDDSEKEEGSYSEVIQAVHNGKLH